MQIKLLEENKSVVSLFLSSSHSVGTEGAVTRRHHKMENMSHGIDAPGL